MKISVKKIIILGIFTALSVSLIYLIRIPFPPLPFLEYDAGDIPIFLCTYLYGSVYGVIIGAAASIVQGLTVSAPSGFIGVLMHIFAIAGYVLPVGLLFRKKTFGNLLISAASAAVITIIFMLIWNLIFTPVFMGAPVSEVIALLPLILLFNVIKVVINTALAVILYKILVLKPVGKIID